MKTPATASGKEKDPLLTQLKKLHTSLSDVKVYNNYVDRVLISVVKLSVEFNFCLLDCNANINGSYS